MSLSASDGALDRADHVDRYQSRLAFALQQMAGFGANRGEAALSDRADAPARYDIFSS